MSCVSFAAIFVCASLAIEPDSADELENAIQRIATLEKEKARLKSEIGKAQTEEVRQQLRVDLLMTRTNQLKLEIDVARLRTEKAKMEIENAKTEKTCLEENVARLQIEKLGLGAENSLIIAKKYPIKIEELIEGKNPQLAGGQKTITDPWGKKFQYDPKGPKNQGKKPDIWTETPDKKIIGNWPEEKK
jgi:hypothetical protein